MTIHRAEQTIPRPAYLGGQDWTLRRLTDITVLMGKNGSGKSVLLRAWRDLAPEAAHYVVPERTGEMDFQPHFIQEEFDGARRKSTSTRNFVSDYRRRIVTRVHTYLMIRGNARGDGAALGSPAELETLLGLLVPEFSVQLSPTNPPYSLKRVASGEEIKQIDQLSSGEAQLFTMSLDILTIAAIWEIENRSERILLLDEPDPHVHPDLQARFADFLIRLVDRFFLQLIVATHSTSLMSALGQFGRRRTSVIYVERRRLEYTAQPCDDVTVEVAACLGGHVLMGPLFGAPLLLVEGDDDYRIWSQVPRHHVVNLAVLPCNGEEIRRYQATLERILGSLCEKRATPMGYALLDGDKTAPMPNASNPQEFIRYINLSCREAENLYLTDTILAAVGHTWTSACEALLAAAGKFGQKQEALERSATWDRREVDVKNVINEIATILDPKGVPWSVRVGVTIGRERPSGDLAEFLGREIVESLWGP